MQRPSSSTGTMAVDVSGGAPPCQQGTKSFLDTKNNMMISDWQGWHKKKQALKEKHLSRRIYDVA